MATDMISEDDTEIAPEKISLQKFLLYETRMNFYLVGHDKCKEHWRILKIDRREPSELVIHEDAIIYTDQMCKASLAQLAEGNRSSGGLQLVTKAYGIIGFIKFLESWYMILCTKRRQIGNICGHAIYGIDETQLLTIAHPSVQSDLANSRVEVRYRKLLSGVDLTKDFFFSYTYPVMHTLQHNFRGPVQRPHHTPSDLGPDGEPESSREAYESMFVWNAFLTREVRKMVGNTRWTVALVHGFFEQAKLSAFGRVFVISLISRRSRHFAGTRYLKRGVSETGRVANEVETEQMVVGEGLGRAGAAAEMTSVVQVRGSIPLFWCQETSRLNAKPDIQLHKFDPMYTSTRLHFEDLEDRYGNPVIILNLIKTVEKRPREMILRREFGRAAAYLNLIRPQDRQLQFIHWDFHKFSKSKVANIRERVMAVLGGVANQCLDQTGFFYSGRPSLARRKRFPIRDASSESVLPPPLLPETLFSPFTPAFSLNQDWRHRGREGEGLGSGAGVGVGGVASGEEEGGGRRSLSQKGVQRTNCIDCLDRTNEAQTAFGLQALARQLKVLGLAGDDVKMGSGSEVALVLMGLYVSMGNALALQYGGSATHNTMFLERDGSWRATQQSREFLTSLHRFYNNAYADAEKQDAINLFLGHFQPQEGRVALWELDNDTHLHVGGRGSPNNSPRPSWRRQTLSPQASQIPSRAASAEPVSPPSACVNAFPVAQERVRGLKLTSFDKLIGKKREGMKRVRIYPDTEAHAGVDLLGEESSEELEVQYGLQSPEWLFGHHKKVEEGGKAGGEGDDDGDGDGEDDGDGQDDDDGADPETSDKRRGERFLGGELMGEAGAEEVEMYERYIAGEGREEQQWYGSMLMPGTEKDCAAYRFYEECCQGPQVSFEHPPNHPHRASPLYQLPHIGEGYESEEEREEGVFREALSYAEHMSWELGSSIPGLHTSTSSLNINDWMGAQEKGGHVRGVGS